MDKQKDWIVLVPPRLREREWARTTGRAFDYAVRAVTWGIQLQKTAAYTGMTLTKATTIEWAPDGSLKVVRPTENLVRRIDTVWSQLEEAWNHELTSKSTGRAKPSRKLWGCTVILAWFEQVYRTNQTPNQLLEAENLEQLLKTIPLEVVEDLDRLYDMYRRTLYTAWRNKPATLNPAFQPLGEVRAADADWIVEHTLWECKTTLYPKIDLDKYVRQLIGYALLDQEDKYGIRRVGLYYARYGMTLEWGLEELLEELTGERRPLKEWRRNWKRSLTAKNP